MQNPPHSICLYAWSSLRQSRRDDRSIKGQYSQRPQLSQYPFCLLYTSYITVDTLKYLKKGGRITAAAAAFGTVLGIKPVLQIQGEKLDAFAMAHGMKSAKKQMLDAVEKDLETRFAGKKGVYVAAAYTCSDDEAKL